MNNQENINIMKWLGIASRMHNLSLDRKLKPYRLNSSLYYYIIKVYNMPNITQDKLVSLVYLNPSNVTRAVNQLINLGYLIKTQSKEDKRTSVLNLTEEGKRICPEILNIINESQKELLKILPTEEQDIFLKQLKNVALQSVHLV